MNKIDRLVSAPAAFADIGKKVNELVDATKPITAGKGIKVTEANGNILISTSGGGGILGGSTVDYVFEEFTICVDGLPETRWWPTWLTNPSP